MQNTTIKGATMSKAVLISIQPKWVEKIASGEKTIEVRKSRPKLETPFKVYIYCTKGKPTIFESDGLVNGDIPYFYNGYVMGEFVCDRIDSYVGRDDNKDYWDLSVEEWEELKKKSCLTIPQILEYTGDCCRCYGWHITDLKIYDEPKELGEFRTPCKMGDYPCCGICDYAVHGMDGDLIDCDTSLTRPPQSWCYVEVQE